VGEWGSGLSQVEALTRKERVPRQVEYALGQIAGIL
jgi:hypothetical protein